MSAPESITFEAKILISIQRAMWNMVTPELRSVSFTAAPARVTAAFTFDRMPTEDDLELVSEMETEVIADLPSSTAVEFTAEYRPGSEPRSLPPGARWLYLRREAGTD